MGGEDDEEEADLKRCEQEGNGCEFSSQCADFKRQRKSLREGGEGEKHTSITTYLLVLFNHFN